MTSPAAVDREGCSVLELPVSAPGVAVAEAIVRRGGAQDARAGRRRKTARRGGDAARARSRPGQSRPQRSQRERGLSRRGVLRVDGGRRALRPRDRVSGGTVLEWSPGLTAHQYEPG